MTWLKSIPWWLLVAAAVMLAIVPLGESHLSQKGRMLFGGALRRPLDWFDLIMHSSPLLLRLQDCLDDPQALTPCSYAPFHRPATKSLSWDWQSRRCARLELTSAVIGRRRSISSRVRASTTFYRLRLRERRLPVLFRDGADSLELSRIRPLSRETMRRSCVHELLRDAIPRLRIARARY